MNNNLHSNWKGDKVGNKGLHAWIRRHINKPKLCEHCKDENKKVQLANKTGIYNREFKNWFYLCAKCHIRYDKAWLKRKDNYFKKGHKKTEEHLNKIKKSLKGREVWNKGKKGTQSANGGSFKKGEEHSEFMKEIWKKRKSYD
ncbi:MAG TPA: hypothetical protein VF974_07575 [Patescibacteria group bacterium]